MRHIWPKLLSYCAAKLAALVVLAVVAAGCGSNTPVITKPTPSPSASASPTAKTTSGSKGLTLAEATSPGYIAKFPLVDCNTLSASAQTAWATLLAGSSTGKCAPANFLTQDVPLVGINVENDDSSISQAQANAYGKALITSLAWINWAAYGGSPGVLAAIPFENGPIAPEYQMIAGGGVVTTPIHGIAAYPEQLILVPLNSAGQTAVANTTASFALIANYGSYTDEYTWSYPSGSTPPFPLKGSDQTTPAIYDGSISTNAVLGTFFSVNTYGLNCSVGPAEGICQAAGVS